jgi:hypothetical protein
MDASARESRHTLEYESLRSDLRDLAARVGRLESVLTRGLLLLVANLFGVVSSLAFGLL